MNHNFDKLGVALPQILLPDNSVDLHKWAVVACDQYTSQPRYWDEVADLVGSSPSTLHLILPEIYLGAENEAEKVACIQERMCNYLETGVLKQLEPGFIYIERETHSGIRRGLMVALDLEHYDFRPGSQTLIRATEGTVLERIPPRVRIREGAPIEVPHVMVLIDDVDHRVIEPLSERTGELSKVYESKLMMGGGQTTGYLINDQQLLGNIVTGLQQLVNQKHFEHKYGVSGCPSLLFAVGDGNHSLATAKVVWEKIKANLESTGTISREEILWHPARYALVELVNVHDPSLNFEPIHRVLFNINSEIFWETMRNYYLSQKSSFIIEDYPDVTEVYQKTVFYNQQNPTEHFIGFVTGNRCGLVTVGRPGCNLAVGTLQAFLDDLLQKNSAIRIDYVHGASTVAKLGSQPGNIGLFLPPLQKTDLFKTVILDGVLPRKTFSMGEAEDKRFYMECRRII